MGRADAGHDIRVYERDPEGATYGWGLVFSDVALSFVRDIAPEVYESMTRGQVVFDDMAIVHQGQHVTLAGNTFHRMARIDLLSALHRHCRQVGVGLEFDRRCDDVAEFADCELIVAADGANSAIRTRYRERFEPTLDERPNLLAWYGTTRLFEPLSLIFRQNQDGLIIAHCYQYSPTHSTFLVEVPPEHFARPVSIACRRRRAWRTARPRSRKTWRATRCCRIAAPGSATPSSRTRNWYFDNVVLLGDALRTGHPSIGSGTRLAMQDCDRAVRGVSERPAMTCPRMLEEFRRLRRPGSDSLQQAAIRSTEWYENLGPKLHLDPISFAYDYLRRSGRVSHAEIQKRDPVLAAAYERLHPAAERS